MKFIIIEDEKVAAARLKDLLHKCDSDIFIVDIIQSVKNAIRFFKSPEEIDFVFMDIHLSDGLSFEIFENIEVEYPIIFTTAYDEYALKAFKVNSIDYLLKPIDEEELCAALDKLKSKITQKQFIYQQEIIDNVLQSLQGNFKTKFVIKVGEHLKIIPTDQINCFFTMEKATFLQTKDKREYALNYSLEQIEEMVDPKQFFRINRQYLISLSSLIDIVAYSNSRLKLRLKNLDEQEIIVSRDRVQKFKEWIEN